MRIPVFIDERAGIDRPEEIIVGGVPLERGARSAGGWFVLRDPGGRKFPIEGTPAAWWDDGSVKWLHLCGVVDLKGGQRNEFALCPADGGPAERLSVRRG